MKIIFTSDLHHGFNIQANMNIENMIEEIKKENPDLVVLCGDIGEGLNNIQKCLDLFKGLNTSVILGNHDLWNYGNYKSIDLWKHLIPTYIKRKGFSDLEDDILIFNNIAVVGTIAWYDYSSKHHKEISDNYYFKTKGKVNNDGNYIDWNYRDIEIAEICKEKLKIKLEILEKDSKIETVIVATHVPVLARQMISYSTDNKFANAYFGNFTLGNEIMKLNKVKYIVSGHTHRATNGIIDNKEYYTIGSDYGFPKYITLEIGD